MNLGVGMLCVNEHACACTPLYTLEVIERRVRD